MGFGWSVLVQWNFLIGLPKNSLHAESVASFRCQFYIVWDGARVRPECCPWSWMHKTEAFSGSVVYLKFLGGLDFCSFPLRWFQVTHTVLKRDCTQLLQKWELLESKRIGQLQGCYFNSCRAILCFSGALSPSEVLMLWTLRLAIGCKWVHWFIPLWEQYKHPTKTNRTASQTFFWWSMVSDESMLAPLLPVAVYGSFRWCGGCPGHLRAGSWDQQTWDQMRPWQLAAPWGRCRPCTAREWYLMGLFEKVSQQDQSMASIASVLADTLRCCSGQERIWRNRPGKKCRKNSIVVCVCVSTGMPLRGAKSRHVLKLRTSTSTCSPKRSLASGKLYPCHFQCFNSHEWGIFDVAK